MSDNEDNLSNSHSGTHRRIMARSKAFLADLVERMRPQLKWVAKQQTQSVPNCKEDESDIVQKSLIKVFEKCDQFEGQTTGAWRNWVVKIVRNQAKDVRRFWIQECRSHTKEKCDSKVIDCLADMHNQTPSKIIDAQERQQLLDTALVTLSIQDQQLVRWRVYHYETYKDIASRLDVTEPTARRRCELAREAFKEALERLGA